MCLTILVYLLAKKKSILCTQSGGIDNVTFSAQDVVDYLSKKRQRQLEKGDAQTMLTYFKSCQLKNPGFLCHSSGCKRTISKLFWGSF